MGLNVRVFYHDKCFDGACSASLFARFHRERIDTGARYGIPWTRASRRSALFVEEDFTGDQNAIVDFKYSSSPRVTLVVRSPSRKRHVHSPPEGSSAAFLSAARRMGPGAIAYFYDPSYTSCTSFIAHIAETRFGFNVAPVAELVRWADIVDGALYESPEAAVAMAEPAMKLTLAIESTQDPAFIPRLIPLLTTMSLQQILAEPFARDLLDPLLEGGIGKSLALIRERAELLEGTIYFDITDHPARGLQQGSSFPISSTRRPSTA